MADHYLHTVSDLPGVPRFALRGINARSQDSGGDSLVAENSLQPGCHVVLLREHGEDLTPPSLSQFPSDLFDQLAFLGINTVFRKFPGFRDHESDSALKFRVELG